MKTTGYDFYLGGVLLPVAPEKLEVKISSNNKTVVLINEGQINMLKNPKLTDFEFTCLIPVVNYSFAVYENGFKEAGYFLEHFENLMNSKTPFQFIVSRVLPNAKVLFSTNVRVSLENYTITENAKDGLDLSVKIKLKQYRDYSTKTVKVQVRLRDTQTSDDIEVQEVSTDRPETEEQSDSKRICICAAGTTVIITGPVSDIPNDYEGPRKAILTNDKINKTAQIKSLVSGAKYPYCLTDLNGAFIGYCSLTSVKKDRLSQGQKPQTDDRTLMQKLGDRSVFDPEAWQILGNEIDEFEERVTSKNKTSNDAEIEKRKQSIIKRLKERYLSEGYPEDVAISYAEQDYERAKATL